MAKQPLTTMEEERESESTAQVVKMAARTTHMKMSFKYKLLLILVSLVLMGMLRTGFLFVIIAMLPSVVAYYTDVSQERYTFKTIFACNLAGMLPSLGRMLHAGPSSALLQLTMSDVSNWMIIYGAGMMGWLLIEICPMFTHMMIANLHGTQVSRIERTQKKIESEWGPEVMQTALRPESEEDE